MLKPYINMSVSTISIIFTVTLPNKCCITSIHLKQVIFQVGNAPSWNISIKSYMMCPNLLKPKYICLFPHEVSLVTVTLPN